MDRMEILCRLISLKNNALQRASENSLINEGAEQDKVKGMILERGIKQLIMEIQNAIFAVEQEEYRSLDYHQHKSAKAS
ncbi:MAG TPA: hypothetical protein VN426_11665 [Syntrophomonadaceae bacterium]|nr:hypothetical protein [Syntrophomonadaceae bacterium]